ncbi:NAD(P)H-binding protein [Bradyrhizobium sp. TZ2]
MSRKAHSDESADVEWVRGDMMDPASLDRALQGVDVVVSSANGYMKGGEASRRIFRATRTL